MAAAANEPLDFVRDALARNVPRAEIEAALLQAGWSRDVVRDALEAYADVPFPVPVPRPRVSGSARDAFLHLLLFMTLGISACSFGAAVFAYIDRAFPDAAAPWNEAMGRQQVRWALSSLIVAFPVFAYVSALIARQARRGPAKRRSPVRRWLLYLAVFIASSVLIGDFTTLVYNALGGELTVRLVLKVLTIAGIGGAVLAYYLSDLRLDDSAPFERPAWIRALGVLAAAAVSAAVVAGLLTIGRPGEERTRRLDARRVEDLRAISNAARVYYARHRRLPQSLGELTAEGGLRVNDAGEDTGPYEYRTTGPDAFEVCAEFQHDSSEQAGAIRGGTWAHGAGRQCFPFQAATPPDPGAPHPYGR